MPPEQILLLPKDRYFDWVQAAKDYVMTYGANVTPDPATAARSAITVTAPDGAGLFPVGDLAAWFNQNFPNTKLDLVAASGPGDLSAALKTRMDSNDRYGQAGQPSGALRLLWPTDYNQITQPFGVNPQIYARFNLPGHEGIDFRASNGSNIYACADGTVFRIDQYQGNPSKQPYGNAIRIQHRDGYQTVYAHLVEVLVNVNDRVKARQLIGKADSTGNSTASHLHLTLKKVGATAAGITNYPFDIIDPTPFLAKPGELVPPADGGATPGTASNIDYKWPAGKCLVGAHTRADGPMMDADLAAVRIARIEAVKLMTTSRPENVDQLRQINPAMFIMVRMHAAFEGRTVRPDEFAHWMEGDMAPFYSKGIRYFEVHNEPNLTIEGWRTSWQDGREFGTWFMDVVGRLRAVFPEVKFGYPGVSPGGQVSGLRMDAGAFLGGSEDAINRADWLGVHCYWTDEVSMGMAEAGRGWEAIRRRHPEKLLFITEFANVSQQDTRSKGLQYAKYYETLRNQPGMGAAFSFVLSASSGFPEQVWRGEDGGLTEIPAGVGARTFA
ncbi:MAG: M23 family metallopeptidase [Chloroflexi bacterium]|nr:M23 family metallopeptidase [Chloroflexota bacterium]